MKNPNIIAINDELKTVPFLYIENDDSLSDLDKDNIESVLGGMGAWADLKEYNIEYLFSANSNKDTFNKIIENNFILLNTTFKYQPSDTLLYNFVLGAKQNNLKDKIIINCLPLHKCSTLIDDISHLLKELDEDNNISFYFKSRYMDAFVKLNNIEGFM